MKKTDLSIPNDDSKKTIRGNYKILVTGGAGFIGSNLCQEFLKGDNTVYCLDNLATGKLKNIEKFIPNPKFSFIEGDIRDQNTCIEACENIDYVFHQAALGSVPRSINDPIASNEVNISGFLNMIIAARDQNVKRFIYAASSSTYGDSKLQLKTEDNIGKPLSPYAITKYVNELYADVFSKTYGIETIGLRYFNVFGRNQDPNGAYAAVIPKFVTQFINHTSPTINGDGKFSRDFTYIDNVIQANKKAMLVERPEAINTVYNVAYGERTTLKELAESIKKHLSVYDLEIGNIPINYGPERKGDIPHSLASIDKAKRLLEYNPKYNIEIGLEHAVKWYWENFKNK